jgi:hypothetical protein
MTYACFRDAVSRPGWEPGCGTDTPPVFCAAKILARLAEIVGICIGVAGEGPGALLGLGWGVEESMPACRSCSSKERAGFGSGTTAGGAAENGVAIGGCGDFIAGFGGGIGVGFCDGCLAMSVAIAPGPKRASRLNVPWPG